MKISEAYPSNYIKASDLQGKSIKMTIERVEMEDLGDDGEKPCLFFKEAKKGIILNKTNSNRVATLYGDETDQWVGNMIEVYPDVTEYKGQTTDCVRLRAPVEQADQGEDIPF